MRFPPFALPGILPGRAAMLSCAPEGKDRGSVGPPAPGRARRDAVRRPLDDRLRAVHPGADADLALPRLHAVLHRLAAEVDRAGELHEGALRRRPALLAVARAHGALRRGDGAALDLRVVAGRAAAQPAAEGDVALPDAVLPAVADADRRVGRPLALAVPAGVRRDQHAARRGRR